MKRYSGIIILALLAAVVFAPFNVPFTLETVASVLPARQWVLLKSPEGALSATLYDNRNGLVGNREAYQFERGDLVQMRSKESWKSGGSIKAGEIVAAIGSNRLNEQLMQLKNQLAVEQASLNVVSTGQKPQVITQLEEEINLVKADLELRKKNLERTRQLHTDGLAPATLLDQAENAYNESLARLRVAEKSLAVGATGEKQESVWLAQSRIAALQKQIEFLEKKETRYSIAAPFDGLLRFEVAPDGDKLFIEDASTVILQLPIRLRDSRYVLPGQNIELQLVDNQATVAARVLEIGSRVEILVREQVVMVKAAPINGVTLTPGMPVRCWIVCDKVRVSEFLKRSIRWQ
ncbi:MAG: HlyD family secretion protein [Blastocatellia bacterium]